MQGYDAGVYGGLEPEYYWALCESCGAVLDPGWFYARSVYVVDSVEEWCEELCEDSGCLWSVPDFIRRNIDFGGIAQELFLAGDYTAVEYGAETIIYSGC